MTSVITTDDGQAAAARDEVPGAWKNSASARPSGEVGSEPYSHSHMILCQLAVALSWPTAASVITCIRLDNSDSAGIVSFFIRSQYCERGSPAWASSADTYCGLSVTILSSVYQAL